MPSLVEIKAAIDALAANSNSGLNGRTPIPAQAATYTISAPGNYVLTGNVTVPSGNGINISANDVTLDLNGFSVTTTAASPSGAGITILMGVTGIKVRNGSIGNYPRSQGFLNGVLVNVGEVANSTQTCDDVVLEDLRIITGGNSSAPITRAFFARPSRPPQCVCGSASYHQGRGWDKLAVCRWVRFRQSD